MSMISTAYVAHYNAPRFLTELKEPSMRNYNRVIAAGFGISFAVRTVHAGVSWL
jgi:amino acid permease